MKHLYLLSVIAFVTICSSCGSSQSNSSSRLEAPERQGWNKQRPLFGDVESVTITYYWLNDKFGEIVRDSIYRLQKYYFNEEGDVIKSNDFNFMNKYTYDSARNITEEARYRPDGSLAWKEINKYDSAGNKTEEAQYGSGGWSVWLQMLIYESNSKENRFEWNSDGSLSWKSIYKYDSRGNMIEETDYSSGALIPKSQSVFEIVYRN